MDRIVQFQRLALLTFINGEISIKEGGLIKSVAIKLGLNPNATNEILKRMPKYVNNVILPEKLIAIYKKYLN